VKIKRIEIDTSGDDKRIVKLADMDVFETTRGIWPFKKKTYTALHKFAHVESHDEWPWNSTVNMATADCIAQVCEFMTLAGRATGKPSRMITEVMDDPCSGSVWEVQRVDTGQVIAGEP
jgi:sigma54-dependent transcription regulator